MMMLLWENAEGEEEPVASLYTGGDAEWDPEEKLASWVDINVDIVKIGHHGSRNGTSRAFIQKVNPEHVLLSAGVMHGHPGQ